MKKHNCRYRKLAEKNNELYITQTTLLNKQGEELRHGREQFNKLKDDYRTYRETAQTEIRALRKVVAEMGTESANMRILIERERQGNLPAKIETALASEGDWHDYRTTGKE